MKGSYSRKCKAIQDTHKQGFESFSNKLRKEWCKLLLGMFQARLIH